VDFKPIEGVGGNVMSKTKVVGKVDLLSDPTASRWFSTIVRDSTKHVYKSALKRYVEFTGLTPKTAD